MADGRGGHRVPRDRTPKVSGVGRNSRRTDTQPINAGRVGDSEDLKHGDRKRLEAAQRMVPVRRASQPDLAAAAPTGPAANPLGAMVGAGSAQLPPQVFGGDSTRPDEPITEGLPFGPGAGPEILTPPPVDDVRQLALERYARIYDNPDAKRILTKLRAPVEIPTMSPEELAPEPETFEPEPQEVFDEGLTTEEEVAVEGDEEGLSVETPEAAPPDEAPTEEPI